MVEGRSLLHGCIVGPSLRAAAVFRLFKLERAESACMSASKLLTQLPGSLSHQMKKRFYFVSYAFSPGDNFLLQEANMCSCKVRSFFFRIMTKLRTDFREDCRLARRIIGEQIRRGHHSIGGSL